MSESDDTGDGDLYCEVPSAEELREPGRMMWTEPPESRIIDLYRDDLTEVGSHRNWIVDYVGKTQRAQLFSSQSEDLAQRLTLASALFSSAVSRDLGVSGGKPVLSGTRFPLSRVFAELAAGQDVSEIADDYELEREKLANILDSLAIFLDRRI